MVSNVAIAQNGEIVRTWVFNPNYTLSGNAKNYPGNKIPAPKSRFETFATIGSPIIFHDEQPTERIHNLIKSDSLPKTAFTVDMWILDHVNQATGVLIAERSKTDNSKSNWLLGYYDGYVHFQINTSLGIKTLDYKLGKGWMKYWHHIVAVAEDGKMSLLVNGKTVKEEKVGSFEYNDDSNKELEVAGYFKNEPYMGISNLLKSCRLYKGVANESDLKKRYHQLQKWVKSGHLTNEEFHFNAGPYLHYATQNSVNIVWETNELSLAKIKYGEDLELKEELSCNEAKYIHEISIDNLEPDKLYYYEIETRSLSGSLMSSGVLTFGTAVNNNDPISFCVIGDTESRPQINQQIGSMIWEERPNFVLHLGDITDGGMKEHKFEWNYEYFTGITPIASRIPFFTVPGNGEGDLYWYKRYHRLPNNEEFYKFNYGNAEFFMLNSNAESELQKGGKQYKWLEDELMKSDATWKFVAHHHCPVSSDENDFGNTWNGEKSTEGDPKFNDIIELYQKYGVDVVFFGHVHAYERTWPLLNGVASQHGGVVYIQSGGGGGNLEDFVPNHRTFSNRVQRGHHYCRVDIFENEFVFKMYDVDGALKDYYTIKK